MKDNKQIWVVVVVAVVVSVISAAVTASLMSNVGLAPGWGVFSSKVNANSCNADEVCEVGALFVEEDSIFQDDPRFELGFRSIGHSYFEDANVFVGDPVGVFPEESSGNLYVEGDLRLGEDSITCEGVAYIGSPLSGDDVCQQNGYDYCLMAEREAATITYYDSKDGSCSGSIQLKDTDKLISDCPTGGNGGGGGGGSGCLQNGADFVEPALGDYTLGGGLSSNSPGRILCCK
jgi:hypothetical protein